MSILKRFENALDERLRGLFSSPGEGAREAIELYRDALHQVAARAGVGARGDRIFPFDSVRLELRAESAERRAILEALFDARQFGEDIRAALLEERTTVPAALSVTVEYLPDAAAELRVFCEKSGKVTEVRQLPRLRLVTVEGVSAGADFALESAVVNVGRTRDVVDGTGRLVRRNQLCFPEELDATVNATVSRTHAHFRSVAAEGEWRLFDDGSSTGTSLFRDGVRIEVPAHAGRGVAVRVNDEIYFGSVRVRVESAD